MSIDAVLHTMLERASPWRSKLREFLEWWGAELRACAPARINNALAARAPKYLVRILRDGYEVVESQQVPLRIEPSEVTTRFIKGDPVSASIEVDDALLLIKAVQVPAAATKELEDVAAFQFKQHFPLKVEALSTGFRCAISSTGQDSVELVIGAVRSDTIERRLSVVRELGFEPVEAISKTHKLPFKVPSIERNRNRQRLVAASLIAVLAVLLTALPLIEASRVRSANENLQAELKALTDKSQAALNLKKTLDQRLAESAFLQSQMGEDVLSSALDFISRESPSDVSLTELQFDGKAFRLSGVGADPAAWVLKLQSDVNVQTARLENVAAAGGEEQRGRFQIRLEVKPNGSGPSQ